MLTTEREVYENIKWHLNFPSENQGLNGLEGLIADAHHRIGLPGLPH
jgi:hypothetical protein